MKYLNSLLLFLYNAGDIEPEEVIKKISLISKKGGIAAMSTASRLIEQGKLEGKLEGIEEGMKNGMKNGMKKGVDLTIIKTAKKMHSLGFGLDDITEVTGLSIKEIEKLIQ